MIALLAVTLGVLEYFLGVEIGLSSLVALVIAVQVGIVSGTFLWLGGVPHEGPGLGRRW